MLLVSCVCVVCVRFLRGEFAPGKLFDLSGTHSFCGNDRCFFAFQTLHRRPPNESKQAQIVLQEALTQVLVCVAGQVRGNHRPCSRCARTDRFRRCNTSCATAKQLRHPPSTCCAIIFDMLFHSCPSFVWPPTISTLSDILNQASPEVLTPAASSAAGDSVIQQQGLDKDVSPQPPELPAQMAAKTDVLSATHEERVLVVGRGVVLTANVTSCDKVIVEGEFHGNIKTGTFILSEGV